MNSASLAYIWVLIVVWNFFNSVDAKSIDGEIVRAEFEKARQRMSKGACPPDQPRDCHRPFSTEVNTTLIEFDILVPNGELAKERSERKEWARGRSQRVIDAKAKIQAGKDAQTEHQGSVAAASGSEGDPNTQENNNARGDNSEKPQRERRAVSADTTRYWPSGEVPYEVQDFSSADLEVFNQALQVYNTYTCVKFRPAKGKDSTRLVIKDGDGCASYIGMKQEMREQTLFLAEKCRYRRIIEHELAHALGVYHEQTRPDRQPFITVHPENILPGAEINFQQGTPEQQSYFDIPYDYTSLMHYGQTFFSISNEKRTMTAADSSYQALMGTYQQFSFADLKLINTIYPCEGCPDNTACMNGGFRGPDCNCWCDSRSRDSPLILCDNVPLEGDSCKSVDGECPCYTEIACSSLPNTECQNDKCICTLGTVEHLGECLPMTEIFCDVPSVDCKCSITNGCDGIANSACDSELGSCECLPGYIEDLGRCVIDMDCVSLGTACRCEERSDACLNLANSQCDGATSSCECSDGYEQIGDICQEATNVECLDAVGANCTDYYKEGYCSHVSPMWPHMKTYCPKTCYYCNCMDAPSYATSCPVWAAAGYCDQSRVTESDFAFISTSCKQSCGFCGL